MNRKVNTVCAGVLLLGLMFTYAHADQIIYSHSFSGDGTETLTGTAPDTAPDGVVWLGVSTSLAGQWWTDGTIIETNNARRNMFLPFTPEPGKIYRLKIDAARIGTLNNLQFGFVQNANGTGGFPLAGDNVGASPWMNFAAINGNVNTFLGPNTDGEGGQISGQNPDEMNTLEIILNTQTPAWQVTWLINGISVRTGAFTANPTINYVGFGRYNQGTFTVDHFELSVISASRLSLILISDYKAGEQRLNFSGTELRNSGEPTGVDHRVRA